MSRFSLGLALVAGLLVSGTAYAQPGTAASFWNDPYHRDANQQAHELAVAEAQLRARNNGYGPGLNTTNYNGTVNSYSTYNGTVESSGSTNVVNSNSTSVQTTNSSGLNLTISSGQTSGSANQQAASQANNTGGNASIGGVAQGPRS